MRTAAVGSAPSGTSTRKSLGSMSRAGQARNDFGSEVVPIVDKTVGELKGKSETS